MARRTLDGGIEVRTKISKEEILEALRAITLRDPNIDPDEWSLSQAEDLMRAGAMIRREIITKNPEKYPGELELLTASQRGTETCDGQVRGSCRGSGLSRIWWCPKCLALG